MVWQTPKLLWLFILVSLVHFFHFFFTYYISKSHSLICQCWFTVTFASFCISHVMVIGVHNSVEWQPEHKPYTNRTSQALQWKLSSPPSQGKILKRKVSGACSNNYRTLNWVTRFDSASRQQCFDWSDKPTCLVLYEHVKAILPQTGKVIGVRGGGSGRAAAPPGLEKFQGKLCFQGKRKLLKNPER